MLANKLYRIENVSFPGEPSIIMNTAITLLCAMARHYRFIVVHVHYVGSIAHSTVIIRLRRIYSDMVFILTDTIQLFIEYVEMA